jgi:hypothetical protein
MGWSVGRTLVAGLIMAGAAWGGGAPAPASAEDLEVIAKKTAQAPVIDGKIDKAWDAVKATKATAGEGPQGDVEITIKALYTDTEVFFLFQWPDKTMSLGRMLQFDGKEWKPLKGNEDRFNVAWDINTKDFAQKGCGGMCHKQGKELAFRTSTAGERLDLWHWKAQRTNPVGYADDQSLGAEKKGDSARVNDASTGGGYVDTLDKETRRPRWAFKGGVKPGPILLKKDAVEVKDGGKFKAGDQLPREVLDRHAGSRGDVEAAGVWDKGRWTLEIRRARETADKEADVQFTDAGRAHGFGISVHDAAGDEEHSHTGRSVLKLLFK